jgi:hypothetical protein
LEGKKRDLMIPGRDKEKVIRSNTLDSLLCCNRYPRPMKGIFVAITVMNWTFALNGRLAM